MAWEKGILTDIETAAIAVLIALDDDAETPAPLFKNIEKSEGTNQQKSGYKKCVDHWLGQIGLRDGGVSSFDRY
ncbi:MAG: hypothetical protein U9R68_07725, partial [Planctomycetota bacterium]|nr:hypothetical protein [Planctomycetota bacterium]